MKFQLQETEWIDLESIAIIPEYNGGNFQVSRVPIILEHTLSIPVHVEIDHVSKIWNGEYSNYF